MSSGTSKGSAAPGDAPIRKWSRNYLYGRSRMNDWPLWCSWLLAPDPCARQTCRTLMQMRKDGIDV